MRENDLAVERFKTIEKLRLVNLNTPVERCDRLGGLIPGSPNLFIKRDDYLGFLVGGNKLRKLEYVMADVLARRASTVITVGSVHSNHARVVAMVCKRLGLNCVLILNGEPPSEPGGNFFINKLLGAKLHFIASRDQRRAAMEEVARDLEKKGERVYRVPLGASDEIGSFGLVAAFEELLAQQRELGVRFDAIVLASSSGGTQAGLEVGKRLFGVRQPQIIGVSPDDPAASIKRSVATVMRAMLERVGLEARVEESQLEVDESQVGAGYAAVTEQSVEAATLFRDVEGVLLDPTYTSKAAAGLLGYCRGARFGPGDNVLLWHTGGLLALFK